MGKNNKKKKSRAYRILLRNTKEKVNKLSTQLNKINISPKSFKKICLNTKSQTSNKIKVVKNDCPITLSEEYISYFGKEIPKSIEDLNDVLDIILIQYNRGVKQSEKEILEKIKKALINLSIIFNYYVYDNEIIKLLNLVDICNEKSKSNYDSYLTLEFNNVISQLKRTEEKVYYKLITRLKNRNIQERFISSINRDKKEDKQENENLNVDYVESLLTENFENLII